MSSAHENMDRMYRYQRYFYDATRKYYLLGRDRLMDEMEIRPGDSILEIGCGTGRNLTILANKYPEAIFYGLDASAKMLETAGSKIGKRRFENIRLRTALADEFSFDKTFGLDCPFDAAFFSFSISMIPAWRESIENALANLKPAGSLYIVDFYDQRGLPCYFARLLKAWLRKFHVVYPVELLPFMEKLENDGSGTHTSWPLFKSYSFISKFEKKAD